MKKNPVIIGKFRGKSCDATVYNNNGMLLDRELFNTLINSEDYKRAMQNRYYIGFLGHPDDPNCMNFKEACIVMTSMEMLENGEIWAEFDLIDTPVGRIVKAFIDAGVTFGISIRGAGDVDSSGRVDPDTFVFRGFDLVTFPAYDDAVPEFQEIAASSDIQKQSKYKKVCATIQDNLSKIQSCEALEVIQSQFNENSNEYQSIENRIGELNHGEDVYENCKILQEKLDAITMLYINALKENQSFFDENNALKLQLTRVTSDTERKIRSLDRITSSQTAKLEKALDSAENKYLTAISANTHLKEQNQQYIKSCEDYIKSCEDLKSRLNEARSELKSLRQENRNLGSIKASSEENIQQLKDELENTKLQLKEIKNSNLIYQRKIESTERLIAERDETISGLKSDLRETVTANEKLDLDASNRGEEIESLKQEILSCQEMVEQYQQAYADMCASAVGINVENIPISGNTSPEDLRQFIFGSISTSGIPSKPVYAQPRHVERIDEEDYFDDDSTSDLVSL